MTLFFSKKRKRIIERIRARKERGNEKEKNKK
jgi:hypothetical protein